jgi:hypothetical protein
MDLQSKLQELVKAISAGTYNVAPDALRQGPALGIEDCSPLYHNQTYEEKHIFLQKELNIKKAKGPTVQFIRRLSYGRFGGSAQLEGAVGRERTSDWTRVAVPMCYYSEIRRVTVPAMMVETQGGDKIEDLEAEGGQLNLAGDIEFDLFRGCDDFSNAGVFDGNPTVIPALANVRGLQLQIRQADSQLLANDLMFLAYGAGLSSSVQVGGVLTQDSIEDMSVRSAMNHGSADELLVDPLVQSAYNKLGFAKERINLAGSPQDMTGSDLRRQSTYNGMIQVKASRFLSGKFRPHLPADGAPAAPTFSSADASGTTTFQSGQVYTYFVTGENENGEGSASAAAAFTVTANARQIQITITPGSGTTRFFNVYRSANNGTSATARFIGRVANSGASTTVFYDLANKLPGFVTGVLVQPDTMWLAELAPYSRMKLAVADLSVPEAHFRFLTLCVGSPKKNVLGENLKGGF